MEIDTMAKFYNQLMILLHLIVVSTHPKHFSADWLATMLSSAMLGVPKLWLVERGRAAGTMTQEHRREMR